MTQNPKTMSESVQIQGPLERLFQDGVKTDSNGQAPGAAWKLALCYAGFGVLWILVTDHLVLWLFPELRHTLQNIKGIAFVVASTLLIYWLARHSVEGIRRRAEVDRLRAMKDFAEVLLARLGEAILIIDPTDRTMAWVNPAAEQIFGYSQAELIGQSTRMLYYDQVDAEQFMEICRPVLERGEVCHVQFTMQHKNGRRVETEQTVTAFSPEGAWEEGVVKIVHDITDKVQAQEDLAQSESYYRLLAENTLDVIWTMDRDRTFTYVNPAIQDLTGYTPEAFTGSPLKQHCDPQEYTRLNKIIEAQFSAGHQGVIEETELLRKNGSKVPVEFHATVLFQEQSPVGLQGTARDITHRKQAEQALRASEEKYRLTTENLSELVYRSDPETLAPTYVNDTVETIYGYTPQEWLADPELWVKSLHQEDKDKVLSRFRSVMADGQGANIEYRIIASDHSVHWVVDKVTPVFDDQGRVSVIIGAMEDITERKKQEQQLEHQAFHDLLTGLGNRAMLLNRVDDMEQQARDHNAKMAMLFMDLDDFKLVNDTMGHTFGDWLLKAFAMRLEGITPEDAVAVRFGGDDFILLTEVADQDAALDLCRNLRRHLAEPFFYDSYEMFVSVSIGIGLGHPFEPDGMNLLREADTALAEAKKLGKGNYLVFDESMRSKASKNFQIVGDLHKALDKNQFFLMFQPIVRLETLEVMGFEALIRWNHPEQGLVPPSDFIPEAERSGLITRIGLWVMEQACRQAGKWARDRKEAHLFVSFNLSAKQLHQKDLVESLDSLLTETGVGSDRIRIEVTESSLMENMALSLNVLSQLQKLGILLQIDDFGTGYSSLQYLEKIPAENLKVDKSFVSGMEENLKKRTIVTAVQNLAQSFNMGVVAEGVETREQLEGLQNMGIAYGQGYLFDKPLSAEEAGRRYNYSHLTAEN
ncbi:MAG: EAL domain-containing protein [Desulfatiglandaceae bacterium]